tara:strand:- start:1108 stop:1359 length:252 start_codon:yes stop_codon:yes gene_type:complete
MSKKTNEQSTDRLISITKEYLAECEKHQLFTPNEKLTITRLLLAAIERRFEQQTKDDIYEMRSKVMDGLDFEGVSDWQGSEVT